MSDEVHELRARIAELEGQLAARDRYIAELRDAIAALMDPTERPSQKPGFGDFVPIGDGKAT
jgi:uncharacterized coiled-coil protein SlyX